MKTTVNIDPELVAEAMQLLGTKTKKETIRPALEALIRDKRRKLLRGKLANTDLSLDLEGLRETDRMLICQAAITGLVLTE